MVQFQSKSEKRKPKSDRDEHTKNKTKALDKDEGIQEFNLENARLEEPGFGITGYHKGNDRVLEPEPATTLGAQLPKIGEL